MQLDLIIAEWNANGILNHVNEIETFLKLNYIDILLISETHLTNRSYLRIRDYDVITANQPDNRSHAGSAIIIKSTIKYEVAESITETFLQAAGVQITCDNSKVSIYAVYFPPRYSVDCEQYDSFFQKLGNKFIVGGDFNAKHPWWGSRLANPKGNKLYKCICKNQYNTLSTGSPTYWPSDTAKIPDLLDFIVYKGIPRSSFDIAASYDLSSDHSPIIVNFRTNIDKRTFIPKLITKNTDMSVFKDWIASNLNLNINIRSSDELEDAVESFNEIIHEASYRSTPLESQSSHSNIRLSFEIRHLIKAKRRLRKSWQKSRHPSEKSKLNRATNYLNNRLKEVKNDSTAKFLSSLRPENNNEHNLWKATKYLKRPQKRNVPIKDINGLWCRTDKIKAEAFKTHLENTFKPNSTCSSVQSKQISDYLDVPCQMFRPIKCFTVREVENEIKMMNPKKTPGYDNIDSRVIKALPKKGLIYLTIIFNAVLRLSHIPAQWKYAKIIMILKPNKPENIISSYRPISLLPTISKLFERLFKKRLFPILEAQQLMPDHQFGFRQGHGTPEQCHRVVKTIRESLENKLFCSSVFLDVKQAFDKVWHKGLLFKLKNLLPTPFYLLLKSYLNERKFYVCVNDEVSDIANIESGVPQGSVLGPVLYTLFTADLPTNNDVTVATYADDTAMLVARSTPVEASRILQKQLNVTQLWLDKWNIEVNAEKSTHVTFTLNKDDCPSVSLNGVSIPQSNCVKYLGLHLDKRLTWKDHIKSKRTYLDIKTKKMFWLLGPKSQLSLENKLLIYKSILKPVWTYGIQLWGTASYSNIDIIQKYQSKILRQITNAPWFVRNSTIHNDLKTPFVKEEIKRYSTNYLDRISNHSNLLAITLLDDTDEIRRLKRPHILDLPF